MNQQQSESLIDVEAVAESLRLIVGEGNVFEVRCLDAFDDNPRYPRTFAGYFDDIDAAVRDLQKLKGANGVYFTLNPVEPALLARAANRLKVQGKGESTGDTHIVGRRWLPIDCDPRRPSGISATEAEHTAALDLATTIAAFLTTLGWPEPIVADSGNGAHLLYRIDQPADDGGLAKRVLEALAQRFDDNEVEVDTGVFNPARIWKVYGSLAGKGDSTTDRPHRRASILGTPAELVVVTTAQLESLARPQEPPAAKPVRPHGSGPDGSFDIETFIAHNGLEVDPPHPWQGGTLWTLRVSPLCEHGGDGPFIARHASGAIVAKCQHNSCGWSWRDLREHLEPREDRPRTSTMTNVEPTAAPEVASEPALRWRPFPVEVLPACLRDYAVEVARVVQVDPVAAVLPGLVVSAAAIGGSRVVALGDDWREPSILWGALVAESGDGKTPAAKPMLGPAREADAALQPANVEREAEFEDDKRVFAANLEKWKADHKKGIEAPPPRPPEPPGALRRVVSDITPEAIAPILLANDRLLADRDELSGMLGGMGRYSDGKGAAERAQYLSMHSAEPIRIDRKTGDRRSLHVETPYLSIYGGVQPALLHNVMSGDDVAAGLPARFLWAMPPTRRQRYRKDRVRPETRDAYERAIATLYKLKPAQSEFGEPLPLVVTLSAEAEAVFGACVDRLNDRRADATGPIKGALSKLRAACGRLALVLHCLRDAEGDLPIGGELTIDADTMHAAATLAEWFAGEAERVFAMRGESAEDQQQRDLIRWIEGRGGSVTERDLSRGPRQYRPAGVAAEALQSLAAAGHGEWSVEDTATNQRRVFTLSTTAVATPVTAATVTHSPETADSSESVAVASVASPRIAPATAGANAIDADGWEVA